MTVILDAGAKQVADVYKQFDSGLITRGENALTKSLIRGQMLLIV